MPRPAFQAICLVLCVVVAACGRRHEPSLPVAPTTPTTSSEPAARPPEDAARPADAEEARRREEAARIRHVLEEMVFFDYDSADLRDDTQRTLNAKVAILKTRSDLRLRIEGHADERGSVEYNLALSLRRANRVRDYLVDVGIAPSRLEVLAFGEERPLVEGTNESAWARNRRAEFIVGGAISTDAR